MLGIGWASGLERLINQLQDIHGDNLDGVAWAHSVPAPVAVVVTGDSPELHSYASSAMQHLRHQGFVVPSRRKGNMKKQLKHANQIGAKAALMISSSSASVGSLDDVVFTVRNMESGEQADVGSIGTISDVVAGVVDVMEAQFIPKHVHR